MYCRQRFKINQSKRVYVISHEKVSMHGQLDLRFLTRKRVI